VICNSCLLFDEKKIKKELTSMEEAKNKEERYNEARIMHKSLDEKLQMLQEKPYLTEDEELEMKLLKKKKLYFKDLMERIKEES
jgi:hypothetical protein